MRCTILSLCLALSASVVSAQTPAHVFDVRAFGAKGDGITLDSPAINAAIEAAAATGGGTVHFPAGTYLSFSVRLKSNLTLYLDSGATIEAARPPADLSAGYDAPEPTAGPPGTDYYEDFGHAHWHNSLIWGENLENVAIIGPGRIFGKGLSRGAANRFDLTPEERASGAKIDNALPAAAKELIAQVKSGPFGYPGKDTLPAGVGNKAIALKNCRNVIFRDFTIQHGGHFGILGTGVDNWTIDNLKIDTNRDGMDIDACQNVRVSNCSVNSPNDDGICPKSSYGLGYPRATENITITNCYVSGFDEGTLLDGTKKRRDAHIFGHGPTGRIKCGTESNGGFRNITISNCVFEYCRGLALESVDGALMEDITVTNITMRDIVNAPIYVRLGTRLRGPAGTKVGTAKRIKIDNVVVHNAPDEAGILLAGDPTGAIEDISLSNIFIDFAGGGTAQDAERVVPEYEDNNRYPEPYRLGKLPAWGLFARHVTNLTVDGVEFRTAKPDLRPVVRLDDVMGASFDRAKFPAAAGVSVFHLKDVTGLDIHRSPGLSETQRTDRISEEKL
ncbi:MAG TPA: glycoside hydrolase family 28 protein [Lacunisphaera sp.]